MQIEEGKFYRTRDGRKVGPMKRPDRGFDEYKWRGSFDGNGTIWYRGEDGSMGNNGGDIVAEWPRDSLERIEAEMDAEERRPVRTVTRKEIVPGVYGRVNIGARDSKGVSLGIVAGSNADLWLSASELRAAAATLTEIADALDAPSIKEAGET